MFELQQRPLIRDKWARDLNEKVCGVDIDGVLNYYPDTWVQFVNDKTGSHFATLTEVKATLSYKSYKDLKYEYRECGIKAELEVRAGAKELLDELKRRSYRTMILTSRPFDEHISLFKQTVSWLDKNQLQYDGIIFGENKYVEILTQVPNLRFFIDDHRYHAMQVSKWGYPAFLVNTIYNQGELNPNVHRIKELMEVLDYDFV